MRKIKIQPYHYYYYYYFDFAGFLTHRNRPSAPSSSTLPTSSCPRSLRRTRAPCRSTRKLILPTWVNPAPSPWSHLSPPSDLPSCRYLMNFLLDATLGMLIIWLAVKLTSKLVEYKQWTLLSFGEYGEFIEALNYTGWPLEGSVHQPSSSRN